MQKIPPVHEKPQMEETEAPVGITEELLAERHLYMPEDHMDALYASANPLVRYVHRNRLNSIVGEIPAVGGLNILDAGCGEGHLLDVCIKERGAARNQYYGIDITDIALKKARAKCPSVHFERMNLANIRHESGFFDVVMCTEVIEHVVDYPAVLNELQRVLKRGGILLITFPNEFLWTVSRFVLRRNPVKVPDHVNAFDPKQMKTWVPLKVARQIQLPFNFPFFMSLGSLMKFQK